MSDNLQSTEVTLCSLLIAAVAAAKLTIYVRKRKPLSTVNQPANLGKFQEYLHPPKTSSKLYKKILLLPVFRLILKM